MKGNTVRGLWRGFKFKQRSIQIFKRPFKSINLEHEEYLQMYCKTCGRDDKYFELLEEKLEQIKTWCDAYPLDVFPEPDLIKARKVLKENGMTLDAISASNMRHVLNGIKEIINPKKD